MALDDPDLNLIVRLSDRLERLSADSTYAHRASGLRGSLLSYMQRIENDERLERDDRAQLDQLIEYGFHILALAAREIGASR